MTKSKSNSTPNDYDYIAGMYAACREASPAVIAHIQNVLRERRPRNLLEIGCGTADHLAVLCAAWEASGAGFDLSHEMVRQGELKHPGLDLQVGDAALAFPLPDARFDFAFSVNVIHYIKDLDRFFSEAHRVLSPGGVLLIVTDSEEDILRRTMSHYFPETVPNELKRYPPIARLEAGMNRCGFGQVRHTHTEKVFRMDERELNQYRRKAFSALRQISEEAFQAGLRRLEGDALLGHASGREVYTYLWGEKRVG